MTDALANLHESSIRADHCSTQDGHRMAITPSKLQMLLGLVHYLLRLLSSTLPFVVQIRERRAIGISGRQQFVCRAEAKEKTKEIEENPAENRGEELEVL